MLSCAILVLAAYDQIKMEMQDQPTNYTTKQ